MPHEVKMPQLGMVQDSGVIVAWLKKNGDPVRSGEPIFEVETDKATMEVEAAADGFLSAVQASVGDDVPVGGLIAMIVDTEADVEEATAPTPAPAEAPAAQPEAAKPAAPEKAPQPVPAAPVAPPPQVPRAPASGRVLASPKARRVAAERGIDLSHLRALGLPEPFHVADLDHAMPGGGQSALSAEVDGSAFDGLLGRSENADRTMLLAAFAAGAWRALFQVSSVSIAVRGLDGGVDVIANPDRGGDGQAEGAALSLVDLCDRRLLSYTPAGGGMTLSVARRAGCYALTLSFSEALIPMPQAAALLDDIAARIEDPIRQLL